MICLQPSLPIPGKEAYLPEIGFWQVHDLLRGPSALHRSVREGKDGVALLEVLQSFPCLLHRPHWVIGPYFGMGKTFREASDLQQSTQRNDHLTKVKVETVFRILLLRHFYHLSCISAQFGAPWTPTQWGQQWVRALLSPELCGLQSSAKVERGWGRGRPRASAAWRPEFGPLFPLLEWGQEASLTSFLENKFSYWEGEEQQAEPRAPLSVIAKLNYPVTGWTRPSAW